MTLTCDREGMIGGWLRRAYFVAPKRLSNEFDDTIGAEPETWEPETWEPET
jgi:hypothetical protein